MYLPYRSTLGLFILDLARVVISWLNSTRFTELWHLSRLLLPPVGLLVLVLVSAFGFGAITLRWVGFRDRLKPEFYLFAIALGLGALGHLMLGLGALHLLYQVTAWSLLAVGVTTGMIELINQRLLYGKAWVQARANLQISWFSSCLFLIIVIGLCYPLWTDALAPPISWDEIAYHLSIPQIYLQQHSITYIPFIPYSNWPLEFEMLFTLSLLLSSVTLAHLLCWTTLILICIGLYILGRHYVDGQVGSVAAAVFATTPMVGILAGTALIELPLTFYTFLAVYAWLKWLETGERTSWMLSALFSGLAASIKMNAAVTPLLLGGLMATTSLLRNRVRPWLILKQFVLYGLIAFAVVAPWYLKSWLYTGNPIWPFGQQWLGARDWDMLGSEYLFGYIRVINTPLTPWQWLLNLWRVMIPSGMFGPPRMTLGWLYLTLLLLAIPMLLLLKSKEQQLPRWLAMLALIFYTSWFLQTHQTRFLLPATPILALLAAVAIGWWWRRWQQQYRLLIQVALLLALLATSWLAVPGDRNRFISRWPFLTGKVSYDEFLQAQISGYGAYLYANQHLPHDAYVLMFLYESRGYYLQRNYMWANPIGQRVLRLEQFTNADELATELHKRGITHIFFNRAQVEPYRFIRYGSSITQLSYALLAKHARLLYQSLDLEVYQLLP
ncbi:MAG: glycosyltransferase family 39 protein [Caldilineaceae bacterium]